jgi:hypothetical protein
VRLQPPAPEVVRLRQLHRGPDQMIDAPAPLLLPLLHAAIRRSCMHAYIHVPSQLILPVHCCCSLFMLLLAVAPKKEEAGSQHTVCVVCCAAHGFSTCTLSCRPTSVVRVSSFVLDQFFVILISQQYVQYTQYNEWA